MVDEQLRGLEAAHPELVQFEEVGRSVQAGPSSSPWSLTRPCARPGAHAFIDGCHHGNENQVCEAPLFIARFLADNYARKWCRSRVGRRGRGCERRQRGHLR